jgi:hypothetical protein
VAALVAGPVSQRHEAGQPDKIFKTVQSTFNWDAQSRMVLLRAGTRRCDWAPSFLQKLFKAQMAETFIFRDASILFDIFLMSLMYLYSVSFYSILCISARHISLPPGETQASPVVIPPGYDRVPNLALSLAKAQRLSLLMDYLRRNWP